MGTLKTNMQDGSGWLVGWLLVYMLPFLLSLPTPESLEDTRGRGGVVWGSLSEDQCQQKALGTPKI